MKLASGLYAGLVSHTRVKPRKHKLAYKVFMLLIDLDELPDLKLKTLGVGRDRKSTRLNSSHG